MWDNLYSATILKAEGESKQEMWWDNIRQHKPVLLIKFCPFSGSLSSTFLDLVTALPEVHLLPHHRVPHAEEAPKVVESATVKGVLVSPAMFEVGDAMAWHELPGRRVERNQVQVGAQQEQHYQWEQSHKHGNSQQHAIGMQPQLPGRGVVETRPGETRKKDSRSL